MILIDQLKNVFPIRTVPKSVLLDEEDNSEFSEDIRHHFISKSWDSVTLDDWINTAGIEVMPYYMTPKAFHYYLPSLLCATLENGEYIDWGLKAILPQNQAREPKGDWWSGFYNCINEEQRKVLREYLIYVSDNSVEYSEEKYLSEIGLKIWA